MLRRAVLKWFTYILPLVGRVCRKDFAAGYDVGDASLTRYRRQFNAGDMMLSGHRGAANHNAAKIDTRLSKNWREEVANTVGEMVQGPIKMRKSRKNDG